MQLSNEGWILRLFDLAAKDQNLLMGLGGLLYPVYYLATFLYVAGMVVMGRARAADVFAGLLAFYGLETHTYYIVMVTQWTPWDFLGFFCYFIG